MFGLLYLGHLIITTIMCESFFITDKKYYICKKYGNNMILTDMQLEANRKFFMRILSTTKFYMWPNLGHFYEVSEGKFICGSTEAYNDLKSHTPNNFHKFIQLKENHATS